VDKNENCTVMYHDTRFFIPIFMLNFLFLVFLFKVYKIFSTLFRCSIRLWNHCPSVICYEFLNTLYSIVKLVPNFWNNEAFHAVFTDLNAAITDQKVLSAYSQSGKHILGKIQCRNVAFLKKILFHEAESTFRQKFHRGTPHLRSGKYFCSDLHTRTPHILHIQ